MAKTLKNSISSVLTALIFIVSFQVVKSQEVSVESIDWTKPLEKCWNIDEKVRAIASDNNKDIYLLNSAGVIKKISPSNSSSVWETSVRITNFLKLFVLTDSINISLSDEKFILLSKKTGLYKKPNSFIKSGHIIAKSESFLLFRDLEENKLFLVDKRTNRRLWTKQINFVPNKIEFLSEDTITIVNRNILKVFSVENGSRRLEIKHSSAISQILEFDKETIFFGDSIGRLFQIRKRVNSVYGNPMLKLRAGGRITHILGISDKILVTSTDNFLYYLSGREGKLIWKKRLSGRMKTKPIVVESILLVSPLGSRKIFIINSANGETINQFNFPEEQFLLSTPLFINNSLFLPLSDGFYRYAFGSCK